MGAQFQQRGEAVLNHRQPQLSQPDNLGHRPSGITDFGVGIPPPQAQGRIQLGQPALRVALRQCFSTGRGPVGEGAHIHLDASGIEQIPGAWLRNTRGRDRGDHSGSNNRRRRAT